MKRTRFGLKVPIILLADNKVELFFGLNLYLHVRERERQRQREGGREGERERERERVSE